MPPKPAKPRGLRKSAKRLGDRIIGTLRPPSPRSFASGASQNPSADNLALNPIDPAASSSAVSHSAINPVPRSVADVIWAGLNTALCGLKESSDAFPPLKSAVDGLLACIDIFQVSTPVFVFPSIILKMGYG
jgi:hypothetical protein